MSVSGSVAVAALQWVVEFLSLRIVDPAPFVEVAYHVDDMDKKHSQVFIGCRSMVVDHLHQGQIHGAAHGMNAPCQVDILGIHEKPFVKKAGTRKRAASQKHETALKHRYIKAV